ncbi:EAL domain-containing protein [Aliikangiella coralliicola]|uniref:cyclic-guanylate-specific phosphodiesterase n=1 Tax=Aliikangiella coralliicola TaxID=2592383 RepID=A0A545UF58_9GAMM|nr:EAL domain-containing protein [Aliikangiella coralliicola]TQV88098.1 EAL domain-containing protein [Aliikangiella coralliicola]
MKFHTATIQWIWCLLLILIIKLPPSSAESVLSFQHFSRDKGLLGDAIFEVAQDQHGFIWFAGSRGLTRYDGKNFVHFYHDPDDLNSLSANTIYNIVASRKNFWATTSDGYLNQLLDNGSFKRFRIQWGSENQFLTPNKVLYDQKDGIWITSDRGLYLFSLSRQKFIKKYLLAKNPAMFAVTLDQTKNMILTSASDGEIYGLSLDNLDGELALIGQTPNKKSVVRILIREETWLVGRRDIFRWNRDDDTYSQIKIPETLELSGIRGAEWDVQNRLWLTSDVNGLFNYDTSSQRFRKYATDHNDPYSLGSMSLGNLLIDSQQQLWIASYDNGAFRASLSRSGFESLLATKIDKPGASRDDYCDVSEVENGELFLSACASGFRKLSADRSQFYDLTPSLTKALGIKNTRQEMNTRAHSIENENSIWIGTYDGLIHWNGTNKAKLYNPDNHGQTNAPSSVLSLHRDQENHLWIGSYSGLMRYLPETDDFEHYLKVTPSRKRVGAKIILVIKDASSDELWLGTRSQGLWKVNKKTGDSTQYNYSPENPESLSGIDVFDIAQDQQGNWWVATDTGLNKLLLDHENKKIKFKRFTRKNGLADDYILSIVSDASDHLWLATASGVIRFDIRTETSQLFNYSHGLPRGSFNISTGITSHDGDIYFGGYKGLAKINPNFTKSFLNKTESPLVVTGYGIGNHWRDVISPDKLTQLTLAHDDERLTVNFATLNYASPEFYQYQYRLTGYNQQWHYADSSNTITYMHLPAGNYLLEIKNNLDNTLVKPLKLPVLVHPAPWNSPLAYLIYSLILALIIAIFSFTQWRKFQQKTAYMKAIKLSEERMKLALKGSENVLWDWDIPSGQVYRAGLSFLGLTRKQLPSREGAFLNLVHPEDREQLNLATQSIRQGTSEQYSCEFRIQTPSKEWLWIRDKGEVAKRDAKTGEALRVTGTLQNITERKIAEEELRHLANFDTLTELPNRHHFGLKLANLIQQSNDTQSLLALLFIDLDRFKNINDSLGHQFGDDVLIAVASKMKEFLPKQAFLSRLGGDEFTIILTGINHEHEAIKTARALLDHFNRTIRVNNTDVIISLSIGISFSPSDSNNSFTLLRYADTAMYNAKISGRNAVSIFKPEMASQITKRVKLESCLHKALRNQEFYLVYQPKLSMKTGQSDSCEVLLRWKNKELGLVSPAEFIPILEDTGLIESVGDWILETACRQLSVWHKILNPELSIAINISVRQLTRQPLAERLSELLQRYQLSASRIELEITESVVMENASEMVTLLTELKELGILLSIDDFGTGYSSFAYLGQLPIDKLKIDKIFVDKIVNNKRASTLCQAIVSMAHELGLTVVAEGVEHSHQLNFLTESSCDEIQGFYFSKPLETVKFQEFLMQQDR